MEFVAKKPEQEPHPKKNNPEGAFIRFTTSLAGLQLASALSAAEPKVYRDLAYAEPKHERQTLDVYAATEGKGHPIVFWIHGGGWQAGDKKEVDEKPQAFVDKGFVFVSSNYRLLPARATIKQMAEDGRRRSGGSTTMARTTGPIRTRSSSWGILPGHNWLPWFAPTSDT